MKKVISSTDEVIAISKEELINMIPFVKGAIYQNFTANVEHPIVYVKITANVDKVEAYDIITDEICYIHKDDNYQFIGWLNA